jgi:hypothetical protein
MSGRLKFDATSSPCRFDLGCSGVPLFGGCLSLLLPENPIWGRGVGVVGAGIYHTKASRLQLPLEQHSLVLLRLLPACCTDTLVAKTMLTLAGLASRFVLPLSYTARVMYPGRASSVYRAPHFFATINASRVVGTNPTKLWALIRTMALALHACKSRVLQAGTASPSPWMTRPLLICALEVRCGRAGLQEFRCSISCIPEYFAVWPRGRAFSIIWTNSSSCR